MSRQALDHDLILLGGGLANGLLAYRLRQVRPEIRLAVIESGATWGGNHTWSFHETDLTPAQRAWTAPFVAHRWPGYSMLQRTQLIAACTMHRNAGWPRVGGLVYAIVKHCMTTEIPPRTRAHSWRRGVIFIRYLSAPRDMLWEFLGNNG